MKAEIKKLGEQANKIEVRLCKKLMDMNNHMNECSCDGPVYYDFSNTLPHYEVHTFCLNCGGIIILIKI